VSLVLLPAAFTAIVGLLALATYLEGTRVRVTVRMTVRSRSATPELAEALIAAELAPVLRAHGLQRPRTA
jgi:hypothetical protein